MMPAWANQDSTEKIIEATEARDGASRAEAACNAWFNEAHPMKVPRKTWREKRLERKDHSDGDDTSQSMHDNNDDVGVNMVFELPVQFWAPEHEVAEMVLGAKLAMFEKPVQLGIHMKPLFVRGYVEGWPVQRIMVDGGAGVNGMPTITFEKLGFRESELMQTNTS
jgi:hypothetical protein